jgi:hypothetical protein
MKTIKYETGRDYGAPQVLEITFPDVTIDPIDAVFVNVTAHFVDTVRRISGTVTVFGNDANEASIGRAAPLLFTGLFCFGGAGLVLAGLYELTVNFN